MTAFAIPRPSRSVFSSAASLYRTQTTQNQAVALFLEKTFTVMRAPLLAGLRYQKPRFVSGIWLGGGAQYEWCDPLVVGAMANMTTNETLRAKG